MHERNCAFDCSALGRKERTSALLVCSRPPFHFQPIKHILRFLNDHNTYKHAYYFPPPFEHAVLSPAPILAQKNSLHRGAKISNVGHINFFNNFLKHFALFWSSLLCWFSSSA